MKQGALGHIPSKAIGCFMLLNLCKYDISVLYGVEHLMEQNFDKMDQTLILMSS